MKHLTDINETYTEHLLNALSISWTLLYLSICCLVHAFVPFFFETTVSSNLITLNNLVNRK